MNLLMLIGCSAEEAPSQWYTTDDDGGDLLGLGPDTGNTSNGCILDDCEELVTKINGIPGDDVENPRVGDQWMIRMFCDEALLMGANRLFFQPAAVATVNNQNTDARFIAPGEATMTMQAGSFIYTKDIVVVGAE